MRRRGRSNTDAHQESAECCTYLKVYIVLVSHAGLGAFLKFSGLEEMVEQVLKGMGSQMP